MVDTRFSVSFQIMVTLAYHSDELMSSESLSKVFKNESNLYTKTSFKSSRGQGGGI